MSIDHEAVRYSARRVMDAGAFAERAARAAKPSSSMLGRIGAGVSAVTLGLRLAPTLRRVISRYPAGFVLVAAVAGVFYLANRRRSSAP